MKSDLENLIKEWDAAILAWEDLAKECDDNNPLDLMYKARDLLHADDLRLCKAELQKIIDKY